MRRNLHIVFSHPGPGVGDEEFDRWYDEHLDEILAMPGFHAVQRYRLEHAVEAPGVEIPFNRLAVYEVDDDTARLMATMDEANLDGADAYADRKAAGDDGGPSLPDWWSQVRFASFNCIAIGDRRVA